MLTIFAWMIFVPAFIWNIALLSIAFNSLVIERDFKSNIKINVLQLLVSLAILFIPGVYLFGFF